MARASQKCVILQGVREWSLTTSVTVQRFQHVRSHGNIVPALTRRVLSAGFSESDKARHFRLDHGGVSALR